MSKDGLYSWKLTSMCMYIQQDGNIGAATSWNAEPVIHAGEAKGAVSQRLLGRRLFILITQTDAIYVNDGEEQKYLHQNTFSELQTT